MLVPNFTDPQFVDASGPGGLNAAFTAVSGSVSELGSGAWAVPGLLAPESASFIPSALSVATTLNPPWGIVTSGGAIVRAHGTVTGQDTQAYGTSFTALVPGTGSVTAFLAATITAIQQNPVAIPGPPQGHPSFNPSFIPTVGFATEVYSVSLSAVTGGIDNVNTFELFRTTLTAGQSTIAASAISRIGWARAAPRVAKPVTIVAGGALTVQQAQSVITPTAAGVTHTLPPVSSGGGLAFTFFNPTNGNYTISTTAPDLIGGNIVGSGVNSIVIPTSGSMTVWADPVSATSGIWSILSTSPNMLLSQPNTWLSTQTYNATVQGASGFVSNTFDAGGFQFRAIAGAFGAGIRNDGSSAFLLSTASGSPSGGFNTFRPFQWNLSTGVVEIDGDGAGTTFGSTITAGSGITSNVGNITAANGKLRATQGARATADTNAATLLLDFSQADGGANSQETLTSLPNGYFDITFPATVNAVGGLTNSTNVSIPFGGFPTVCTDAIVCFLGNAPPNQSNPGAISAEPASNTLVTISTAYAVSQTMGVVVRARGR